VAHSQGEIDFELPLEAADLLAHIPDKYPSLFQGCGSSSQAQSSDGIGNVRAAIIDYIGDYACDEWCIPGPSLFTKSVDKMLDVAIGNLLKNLKKAEKAHDIFDRLKTSFESGELVKQAREINYDDAQELTDDIAEMLRGVAGLTAAITESAVMANISAVIGAWMIGREIGYSVNETINCKRWKSECCDGDEIKADAPPSCDFEEVRSDTEYDCDNNKDDDGDSDVDCADSDCSTSAYCKSDQEDCENGRDDNNNGKVDCDDKTCEDWVGCVNKNRPRENYDDNPRCDNKYDDDFDGKTDCDDPDCATDEACKGTTQPEICDNGKDDDGDSDVDCDDADCKDDKACQVEQAKCEYALTWNIDVYRINNPRARNSGSLTNEITGGPCDLFPDFCPVSLCIDNYDMLQMTVNTNLDGTARDEQNDRVTFTLWIPSYDGPDTYRARLDKQTVDYPPPYQVKGSLTIATPELDAVGKETDPPGSYSPWSCSSNPSVEQYTDVELASLGYSREDETGTITITKDDGEIIEGSFDMRGYGGGSAPHGFDPDSDDVAECTIKGSFMAYKRDCP
jgi:hypothetical protein